MISLNARSSPLTHSESTNLAPTALHHFQPEATPQEFGFYHDLALKARLNAFVAGRAPAEGE